MSASKWAEFPVLAFDTETTGVDVTTDRIVTAALVEIEPGSRPHVTNYVVDPGIDIPEAATAVHGHTRETATAQATHTPEQMLAEVTGRIALWMHRRRPVVGMNISYDLSILEAENVRHGVETLSLRRGRDGVSPVVDVLVLDKHAHQFRKGGRKLVDLCAHYGVRHTGAHDAAGDALAAARLWPRIMAKHARKFPGMTLPALHQSQVGWRKDQMDGLRAYFDKNGTDHDGCCPEWPVHLACLRAAMGVSA